MGYIFSVVLGLIVEKSVSKWCREVGCHLGILPCTQDRCEWSGCESGSVAILMSALRQILSIKMWRGGTFV
jgi:hypothetical protein